MNIQTNGAPSPPPTPAFRGEEHEFGISMNVNSPPTPRPSPTPKSASRFQSSAKDVPDESFGPPPHRNSHPIPTYRIHERDQSGPQSRGRANIRAYTDDENQSPFPRLSKPVELLRSAYDVVVIGSGYGGGVAASRMARTGQSVCVLERGRERWPGEYPSGTIDAMKELHMSGVLAPGILKDKMVEGGDPTGMYHMIFGRGQNAVVCNGKSGGSDKKPTAIGS